MPISNEIEHSHLVAADDFERGNELKHRHPFARPQVVNLSIYKRGRFISLLASTKHSRANASHLEAQVSFAQLFQRRDVAARQVHDVDVISHTCEQ